MERRQDNRYRSQIDAPALLIKARKDLGREELKVFLFALCCGLRRSEIDGLEWSAFDFEHGTLRIENTAHLHLKSEESAATVALEPDVIPYRVSLAKALYREAFGRGGPIESGEAVLQLAEAAGLGDTDEMALALNDSAVKQRLRDEVSQAISKGVFGSPLFIVDGEPFWGHDRLDQVDLWLQRGGW